MTILEWFFYGTLIAAILFFILFVLFLFLYFTVKKKAAKAKLFKSKNRKKRKRAKKELLVLEKRKKNRLIAFFLFFIASAGAATASAYISHYQSISLSTSDNDAIVKSYYLLRDFEEQLKIAADEADEESKLTQNIQYLSSRMASYSLMSASELNKPEGQLALNTYYGGIKEIGINASTQSSDFFGNQELVTSFLDDIEKTKNYEKKVFKYYKVNESALKKE